MNVAEPTPQERLQNRLNDPETLASLNHLLDRLDVIAFSLDAVEGFLQRAEVVVESLSSGLQELRPALEKTGGKEWVGKIPSLAQTGAKLGDVAEKVDWESLEQSGLIEKLSAPQTLESVGVLVDKIELAAFLIEGVDGFLRRGDAVADTLAEGADDLRKALPKIDGEQMRRLSDRVPELLEAGEVLAEAGMFETSTVEVLGRLGRTIAESHAEIRRQPPAPVGLFGLLRALKDPQIQNSLQ
ncbi:MAG: DUF1641 domain-containing protein, partial [Acidobacteriota bacterium]